jgi:hypothetical protein
MSRRLAIAGTAITILVITAVVLGTRPGTAGSDGAAHVAPTPDPARPDAIDGQTAPVPHQPADWLDILGTEAPLTLPATTGARPVPGGGPLAAMPARGSARIHFASTLGGQEVQGSLAATWMLDAIGRVHLRAGIRSATAALVQGRWAVDGPALDIAEQALAVEIARTVAMLAEGFPEPGVASGVDSRRIGGVERWPVATTAGILAWAVVPAAMDEAVDPPDLDELRIWTDDQGRWRRAEHRRGSPSRVASPGFLAQRIILDLDR